MSPALLALIVQLVQLAIQEEPAIQAEITALLNKNNPTPADWEALRAKVLSESFGALAPDAKLQ